MTSGIHSDLVQTRSLGSVARVSVLVSTSLDTIQLLLVGCRHQAGSLSGGFPIGSVRRRSPGTISLQELSLITLSRSRNQTSSTSGSARSTPEGIVGCILSRNAQSSDVTLRNSGGSGHMTQSINGNLIQTLFGSSMRRVSVIVSIVSNAVQLRLIRRTHQTSLRVSSLSIGGILSSEGTRGAITLGESNLSALRGQVGDIAGDILAVLVTQSLGDNASLSRHDGIKSGIILEIDAFSTSCGQNIIACIIRQLTNIRCHNNRFLSFYLLRI